MPVKKKAGKLLKKIAKNKEVIFMGAQQPQYDAKEPRYKTTIVGPQRLVEKLLNVIFDLSGD